MPNGISLFGFANHLHCVTLIFFFMPFDSMKLSVNTFASSRLNTCWSKVIMMLIMVDGSPFVVVLLRLRFKSYIACQTWSIAWNLNLFPYCRTQQKSMTGFLYKWSLSLENLDGSPRKDIPFIVLFHFTTLPLILSLNIKWYIFGPNAITASTYQVGCSFKTSSYLSFKSPSKSDVGNITWSARLKSRYIITLSLLVYNSWSNVNFDKYLKYIKSLDAAITNAPTITFLPLSPDLQFHLSLFSPSICLSNLSSTWSNLSETRETRFTHPVFRKSWYSRMLPHIFISCWPDGFWVHLPHTEFAIILLRYLPAESFHMLSTFVCMELFSNKPSTYCCLTLCMRLIFLPTYLEPWRNFRKITKI